MTFSTGPGPIVPSLILWTEGKLSAIFKATTQVAFDTAVNDFLSKDVEILLNGECVSREELKRTWQREKLNESSASVKFNSAIEVPKDPKTPVAVSHRPSAPRHSLMCAHAGRRRLRQCDGDHC